MAAVADKLQSGNRLRRVKLPAAAGEAIAWLHANGEIVDQRHEDLQTEFEVRISDADWARFQNRHQQRV